MEGVIFMRIKPFPFCIKALFIMIAILFVVEAMAAQYKIKFVREWDDKAILKIDRKTYRLKPGEKTPHGIKLVSVTKDEAVVMIEDIKYRYAKGSNQGTPLLARLWAKGGHWVAKGTINDKRVNFFIDTGATYIILSKKHARRLKIRYKRTKSFKLQTASKEVTAYPVILDSVGVGKIVLKEVYAAVVKGYTDEDIILGMSFLGRVKISYDGSDMMLKQ
jgi:aspartyl protease family protein